MKPLIVAGLALGAVVVVGGIAMAASGPTSPRALPGKASNAAIALDAIRTADPQTMQNTGIALATVDPQISAGLVRTSAFTFGVMNILSDVKALVLASLRTGDENQILGVAAILQTKGAAYNQLALDLRSVGDFVKWLRNGAASPVLPAATKVQASTPSTGIASTMTQGTVKLPTTAATAVKVALPDQEISAADAQAIANVIATGDAGKIRTAAAQYRAQGKQAEAAGLEAAANAISNAGQPIPKVSSAPSTNPKQIELPPMVVQSTKLPPVAPGQMSEDPRKVLASKTALALKLAGPKAKGTAKEPKELVRQFQTQEQLARLDGSYGSETGLALAKRYGIVPPVPYYWGKKGGDYRTLTADKSQYKAELAKMAVADPQRRDEWTAAARV